MTKQNPPPSGPSKAWLRINPVEMIIFTLALAVFGRSVYNLVQNPDAATLAMNQSSNRGLASVDQNQPASTFANSSNLASIDLQCETEHSTQETRAEKVRVMGSICGLTPARGKLSTITVSNAATHYTATVFTDLNQKKFSTDYIPVTDGNNVIRVDYSFQDGKTITQDMTLLRR